MLHTTVPIQTHFTKIDLVQLCSMKERAFSSFKKVVDLKAKFLNSL